MIKKEIAIVLGAGSSLTFNLPLGSALRDNIRKSLNLQLSTFGDSLTSGSVDLLHALRTLAKSRNQQSIAEYLNAGREISEALPLCASIDDVVERHASKEAFSACAKLAIAEAILTYERKSGLRQDPSKISEPDISNFDGSWASQLLQLITRGCSASDLSEAFSRLKVINFNYDRCFEQFSFLWLKRVYRLSNEEASNCIKKAAIIHPYGSLGDLPFRQPNQGVSIGYHASPSELLNISKNIFTYSESRDSDRDTLSIGEIIDSSRSIIFFGFAFHAQNIRLLTTGRGRIFNTRHVYTTDVDVPEPRWNAIKSRVAHCLDVEEQYLSFHRSKESCEKLIVEFAEDWTEY